MGISIKSMRFRNMCDWCQDALELLWWHINTKLFCKHLLLLCVWTQELHLYCAINNKTRAQLTTVTVYEASHLQANPCTHMSTWALRRWTQVIVVLYHQMNGWLRCCFYSQRIDASRFVWSHRDELPHAADAFPSRTVIFKCSSQCEENTRQATETWPDSKLI